ncbi:MAG: hypothetical protein IJS13_06980 [Paludibacteraceae bacterium]|nr:hypothetical protein [Paludibacteraceae bacterium]
MYKYFQPNVKRNKKRAGDCVVRAIVATTGKSWLEVYDLLCAQGRELQVMPNCPPAYRPVLKKLGFEEHSFKVERSSTRPTAETLTKEYKCPMLVETAHHLIGCLNGDILDSWDSSQKPAYKFYTKSE